VTDKKPDIVINPNVDDPNIFLDSGKFSTIRIPKTYQWEPQPDITTYELALCVPALMYQGYGCHIEDYIAEKGIARHFREVTP
jgi:hypothetical protein